MQLSLSPFPGGLPGASKKNDSCHVEQKNWSVVRRLVGYDLLRLYVNFFQPVMKLVAKTRHRAKVHKVYDTARPPYQRLLEAKREENTLPPA